MPQSVSVIVEGGKATAAPPLGPALGPLGVPIGKVVEEINKKTAELKGMQVPVKVTVNSDKTFNIDVGTPPASALIAKEAGVPKGSGEAGKGWIGKLKPEQAKKIAKAKFGSDEDSFYNQIVGTARSMAVYVGEENVTIVKPGEKKKEAAPAPGAAPTATPTASATPTATPAGKTPPPAKKEEVKKRKVKKGR